MLLCSLHKPLIKKLLFLLEIPGAHGGQPAGGGGRGGAQRWRCPESARGRGRRRAAGLPSPDRAGDGGRRCCRRCCHGPARSFVPHCRPSRALQDLSCTLDSACPAKDRCAGSLQCAPLSSPEAPGERLFFSDTVPGENYLKMYAGSHVDQIYKCDLRVEHQSRRNLFVTCACQRLANACRDDTPFVSQCLTRVPCDAARTPSCCTDTETARLRTTRRAKNWRYAGCVRRLMFRWDCLAAGDSAAFSVTASDDCSLGLEDGSPFR